VIVATLSLFDFMRVTTLNLILVLTLREPISLGDAQLDNFSELYCFLYVDIL
jgi:hypothetical protein